MTSVPVRSVVRALDLLEALNRQAVSTLDMLIRQEGYALRDTRVVPATNTLAVPVFDAHGAAAALGLTFFASTMRPEQAVERFLPELQALARAVGERLQALQQ